jgi:phage-related minor tail protein
MAKLTVADLEVLFTANTTQVEKADKQIVAIGKKVESNPLKVDADTKPALQGMDRVENAAKKLVSERAVVKLDADISRAEKNLARAVDRLEDLHVRAEGGLDVTADVKRAEASIVRLERQLDGLKRARNVVGVEVETEEAESGLKRFLSLFKKRTEDAGSEGGRSLAKGLDSATRTAGQKVGDVVGGDIESTLIDALTAIPIAGGIVLAAVGIGKAVLGGIQDGLQVEVRQDRLQALTGINEGAAQRLGRAAGEAYSNNFGESIESNMDTTRLALQFRILDPAATTRDAQQVVQGLAGIADVLDEEVRPTAQAVAQMISTGVAKNSKEAFDLLAAGARNGLNRSEDLLDTLTEYPSLFERLGLKGDEALGLINQGMRAGARNSDLAADALKEFQIRATDGSKASADAFDLLGMDAEKMTAKIARGGKDARDGLATVLDKLRETEDPVKRNAAAVGLFGTQAEDLGQALFAMDLSSAVDQLEGVTGSAQRMFDTLASNDAANISQAQRNIEVAADGIKGALAAAFSEPLAEGAEWISKNRGPMLQFFADLVNGAIDFAVAANTGFGEFVSGPLADMVQGLGIVMETLSLGKADTSGLKELEEQMRGFSDSTEDTNKKLEGMRSEFNGFADGQIALGYLNDAAVRTADAIDKVGVAQDGTKTSGEALRTQVQSVADAFAKEIELARETGESQQNLTDRYTTTRDALIEQATASGISREAAEALIDTVLQTPAEIKTAYASNVAEETGRVVDLGNKIVSLPDGDFTVRGETSEAYRKLMDLQAALRQVTGNKGLHISTGPGGQGGITQHDGGMVEFMANGGLRGLTPMSPIAQMVPANTWRVVGDRGDVPEAYIPLDGSRRSLDILFETMRRMGVMPMADGGVLTPARDGRPASVDLGGVHVYGDGLTTPEVLSLIREEVRRIFGSALGGG